MSKRDRSFPSLADAFVTLCGRGAADFLDLLAPGRPVMEGDMNASQGRGTTSSTAWLHIEYGAQLP